MSLGVGPWGRMDIQMDWGEIFVRPPMGGKDTYGLTIGISMDPTVDEEKHRMRDAQCVDSMSKGDHAESTTKKKASYEMNVGCVVLHSTTRNAQSLPIATPTTNALSSIHPPTARTCGRRCPVV